MVSVRSHMGSVADRIEIPAAIGSVQNNAVGQTGGSHPR